MRNFVSNEVTPETRKKNPQNLRKFCERPIDF